MVRAKGIMVGKGGTVVGDAETAVKDPIKVADVAYVTAAIARQVCQHPSGFQWIGKAGIDSIVVVDVVRCPHCGERRRETANGKVLASCAAGGEWIAWN